MTRLLGVGAFLLVLLVSATGRAGCPNRCSISADPPVVTPASSCAVVTTSADDCNCGLEISFVNGCDEPIEALNFEFSYCLTAEAACQALESGDRAAVHRWLDKVGPFGESLRFRVGETQHRLDVAADVRSFHEGCHFSGAGGRRSGAFVGWVLGALGAWAARR
jgi:hypothetical protein